MVFGTRTPPWSIIRAILHNTRDGPAAYGFLGAAVSERAGRRLPRERGHVNRVGWFAWSGLVAALAVGTAMGIGGVAWATVPQGTHATKCPIGASCPSRISASLTAFNQEPQAVAAEGNVVFKHVEEFGAIGAIPSGGSTFGAFVVHGPGKYQINFVGETGAQTGVFVSGHLVAVVFPTRVRPDEPGSVVTIAISVFVQRAGELAIRNTSGDQATYGPSQIAIMGTDLEH